MRRVFKGLAGFVLVLAALIALAYAIAPDEPMDRDVAFDPASLGPDLDAYLATSEARFADLRPGTAKEIIWAGEKGSKTALSVIYLHGFSATKGEISPVPQRVASGLGANLFLTRFAGHGRGSAAMAEPIATDWIRDLKEALAIGRRLGDRVLVISTSTGGTLAALAATDAGLSKDVAGMVFVSPNFGIDKSAMALLAMPFVRFWGPWLVGEDQHFAELNADHARLWTTSYPSVAAIPMAVLVRAALREDFTHAIPPALFIYSDQDRVVQPDVTARIAAQWGDALGTPPATIYHPALTERDDAYAHVIAGDVMSPDQTAPTVAVILDWAKGL